MEAEADPYVVQLTLSPDRKAAWETFDNYHACQWLSPDAPDCPPGTIVLLMVWRDESDTRDLTGILTRSCIRVPYQCAKRPFYHFLDCAMLTVQDDVFMAMWPAYTYNSDVVWYTRERVDNTGAQAEDIQQQYISLNTLPERRDHAAFRMTAILYHTEIKQSTVGSFPILGT